MRKARPLSRVLLRSFAVQGSWNFETMIGIGFAYALMPVLRSVYGRDSAALRQAVTRHGRLFNSHPYLSPLALAAVARLEVERQPPELIDRFKTALRGALGGLGDRVVWAGWRPLCVAAALLALLAGAPWWAAVAGFLLLYNAGHVWLRWWSFSVGWRDGLAVAARLRASWLWEVERPLHEAGPFVLGALLVLLIGGGVGGGWGVYPALGAGAAAIVGVLAGPRVRIWSEVALLMVVFVAFVSGAAA